MHLSRNGGYQYKHIYFEWHVYCGPCFLRRKDSEPKNKQFRPMRDYAAINKWCELSPADKEAYRIY
jgi:hypothetical protein